MSKRPPTWRRSPPSRPTTTSWRGSASETWSSYGLEAPTEGWKVAGSGMIAGSVICLLTSKPRPCCLYWIFFHFLPKKLSKFLSSISGTYGNSQTGTKTNLVALLRDISNTAWAITTTPAVPGTMQPVGFHTSSSVVRSCVQVVHEDLITPRLTHHQNKANVIIGKTEIEEILLSLHHSIFHLDMIEYVWWILASFLKFPWRSERTSGFIWKFEGEPNWGKS